MKIINPCLVFLMLLFAGCARNIAGTGYRHSEKLNCRSFHNRAVGASARQLLSDEKFTALKIEIQYMAGFAPDGKAVAHLRHFLQQRLLKPGGITIVTRKIPLLPDTVLARREILSVERAHRSAYSTPGRITLYILYTNGSFSDDKVLSLAYRNTSAVIFGRKIREYSQGFSRITRTRLETTLLLHEAGHLLGLVNKGAFMQTGHRDSRQGKHCKNRKCLMYYAPARKNPHNVLNKYRIPELDADCLSDLRAKGGR